MAEWEEQVAAKKREKVPVCVGSKIVQQRGDGGKSRTLRKRVGAGQRS